MFPTAGTAAGTGRAAGAGGISNGVAAMATKADAAVVLQAWSSTIAVCESPAGADAGADAVTGRAAGAGGIPQGAEPMAAIPAAAAAATTVGEPAETSPARCEKPALTVSVSAGPAIGLMAAVSMAPGAGCVNVGAASAANPNAASLSSEDAFLT
ncbi:unnamed protein product [Ectocarpus sp. 6 AP-2014]